MNQLPPVTVGQSVAVIVLLGGTLIGAFRVMETKWFNSWDNKKHFWAWNLLGVYLSLVVPFLSLGIFLIFWISL